MDLVGSATKGIKEGTCMRVCRPGFGFSESASRASTSVNAADELHELLVAAGEKPPYVLVGNSLGGANVQLFAYRYPSEVQGLVLVEPMHENEQARIGKASNGKSIELEALNF